jgi:hypothetical protein
MRVPNMLKERAQHKPVVACWHAIEGVGRSLREYYAVPTELPPYLLRLVSKLDATEGNYSLRFSETTPDDAPTAQPRSAGD